MSPLLRNNRGKGKAYFAQKVNVEQGGEKCAGARMRLCWFGVSEGRSEFVPGVMGVCMELEAVLRKPRLC